MVVDDGAEYDNDGCGYDDGDDYDSFWWWWDDGGCNYENNGCYKRYDVDENDSYGDDHKS